MQDFNLLSKNLEKFDGLTNFDQLLEIYLFIKKNFESKGDVIELGTFLGKTTKHMKHTKKHRSLSSYF